MFWVSVLVLTQNYIGFWEHFWKVHTDLTFLVYLNNINLITIWKPDKPDNLSKISNERNPDTLGYGMFTPPYFITIKIKISVQMVYFRDLPFFHPSSQLKFVISNDFIVGSCHLSTILFNLNRHLKWINFRDSFQLELQ